MSFDNLCKLLCDKHPDRFASWILGESCERVDVLKTELSIEPIRADAVTFLQVQERILHLEFQTKLDSQPPLPLRMLDYWVRLYRLYRLPITQVVVLLLPPPPGTVIESAFTVEQTHHQYQVICLWQEPSEVFLNDPALLPLAPLTAAPNVEELLQRVVQRVDELETAQRTEVSGYTQILAGLKFEKDVIRRLFREGVMQESVIYQDILNKGLQKGRQEGRQEGLQEGRQEGERLLVLRLLAHRLGAVSRQMQAQIETLSLEQLEALGEALLDFSDSTELEEWLNTQL